MEFNQVRYFLALAQFLNFTRAAEHCNVTQPALTKSVQKLEQELGGELIYRERQLTQLTDLGRLVLPMLERSMAAAEIARNYAKEYQRREIAPLRIAISPCVSAALLGGPLAEIAHHMPGLQAEVIDVEIDKLPDLLLSGEAHVAIAGACFSALPERIDHWALFEERLLVLLAPSNPLAALPTIPMEALRSENWLERIGSEYTKQFWRDYFTPERPPKILHRSSQISHLQHLAASGLGIMLVPEHRPHRSPLVSRSITGDLLRRQVQLFVLAGRQYTPALAAFIKISRVRDWTLHFRTP